MAVPAGSQGTARVHRKRQASLDVTDCWRWPVASAHRADGRATASKQYVYRLLYILLVNPDLPDDMHLHHECENSWCVNPWHLVELTATEHAKLHARRPRKKKTVCVNGHDLTNPDNVDLYTRPSGKVERQCRLCKRDWKRRKRAELKAAR